MPIDEKNGVISSLYTADGKVKLPRTVDKAVTITTGEHRGKTLDQVLAELTEATVNQGIAMANEISAMQDFAAYSGEETQTCDPEMCRQMVEEIVEERMKEVYAYINLMMQKDIKILSFECPKSNFEKGEIVEKLHLMWELNVEPVSIQISGIGEVEPEISGCVTYKKPITENTTFILTVTDAKGNTEHATLTITFGEEIQEPDQPGQPPVISGVSCFYGTFTDGLTDIAISRGKKLKMEESTSIELTYHNERVFFAYPVSQGLLDDIKDKNGFSYMDSFIMEEIAIGSERYYAYSSEDRASGNKMKFTFIL